jgi:hypothetical protein
MADLLNPQSASRWVLGGAPTNAPTVVSQPVSSSGLTPWQVKALEEYAANMSQSANNPARNQWGVPGGISSPWQGVANMTKELMAGLATRQANQANKQGFQGYVQDATGAWVPASNPVSTVPVNSGPVVPMPTANPWRTNAQGVSYLDPSWSQDNGSAA